MSFKIVIPARYSSRRFPGKMLASIAGKPIIQHTHERALESGADSVIIATDDTRIQQACEQFGATVCMTSVHHPSGTDRLAEAATKMGYLAEEIIVNVQGDEPFIPPAVIRQVAEDLEKFQDAHIATLYEPIETIEALFDTNNVKVVMDKQGYALYFSRAPIPWNRNQFVIPPNNTHLLATKHFRHIGIYAFRANFLQDYAAWEASELEEVEKLEQLRVLWHGGRIHLTQAQQKIPPDINTEEDLEKLSWVFNN